MNCKSWKVMYYMVQMGFLHFLSLFNFCVIHFSQKLTKHCKNFILDNHYILNIYINNVPWVLVITIFHIYTHMSECLYHQIVMNILSVSVDSKLTVLEFITSWGFPFRLPMDVIIIAVKTVSWFHISDKCDCCDGKYH